MPDKLDQLRTAVKQRRDLELQIKELDDELGLRKQARYTLDHTTLPNLFMQARTTIVGIEKDGNRPAYVAKLQPYYKAVISADWPKEKQDAAYALLDKLRMGDIIKMIVEVEFGKFERKAAKSFLAAIKKLVRPNQVNVRQGVPWKTLTAALQDYYDKGGNLGDRDLETLGATVGHVVTLKEQNDG
jgi:hypothetical protein